MFLRNIFRVCDVKIMEKVLIFFNLSTSNADVDETSIFSQKNFSHLKKPRICQVISLSLP